MRASRGKCGKKGDEGNDANMPSILREAKRFSQASSWLLNQIIQREQADRAKMEASGLAIQKVIRSYMARKVIKHKKLYENCSLSIQTTFRTFNTQRTLRIQNSVNKIAICCKLFLSKNRIRTLKKSSEFSQKIMSILQKTPPMKSSSSKILHSESLVKSSKSSSRLLYKPQQQVRLNLVTLKKQRDSVDKMEKHLIQDQSSSRKLPRPVTTTIPQLTVTSAFVLFPQSILSLKSHYYSLITNSNA